MLSLLQDGGMPDAEMGGGGSLSRYMGTAGSRMEEIGADTVWLYFWNICDAGVQNGRFGGDP